MNTNPMMWSVPRKKMTCRTLAKSSSGWHAKTLQPCTNQYQNILGIMLKATKVTSDYGKKSPILQKSPTIKDSYMTKITMRSVTIIIKLLRKQN